MLPATTTAVDMRHTKLKAEEAAILAGEVEKPSWASRNEGIHERVSFEDTIWGFELAGGAYYKTPLRVVYVKPGSRADQACIKKGDTVLRISDIETSTLTLQEAHDLIIQAGIHLRISVTSPDDEEDAYYCYKDPLQENNAIPEDLLRAMEAERIRKAIASATKSNNLKWPWVRRKMLVYRESNCYLVPSKYEGKNREKYPELPHVRYIDDITEVLNKREAFDKEKEEKKLKEEAEKAELEKQRLKEEAEKAEKQRLLLEMEAKIAQMDKEREIREQKAKLEKQRLKDEAERVQLEQRLQEEAQLEEQCLRDKLENDSIQNGDAEINGELDDQEQSVENKENELNNEYTEENEQNDEIKNFEEQQEKLENYEENEQNETSEENKNLKEQQKELEVSNEKTSEDSEELPPESETNANNEVDRIENEDFETLEDVSRETEENLMNEVEDFDELLNDDQSAKFDEDNILDSIISENGHEETIDSSNER